MVVSQQAYPGFLLCYASQKGNAQAIAEDIYVQCMSEELEGDLQCISEIASVKKLKDYSCTIFIGSTTGDGDPPDTAQKFMRELKNLVVAAEKLPWLYYTILGLGDTNYTNFCNFGKTLNSHLRNLNSNCDLRTTFSARRTFSYSSNPDSWSFYDCGWADDGTGLEIVVEPWIEGLLPALKSFLHSSATSLDETGDSSSSILEENFEPVIGSVVSDVKDVIYSVPVSSKETEQQHLISKTDAIHDKQTETMNQFPPSNVAVPAVSLGNEISADTGDSDAVHAYSYETQVTEKDISDLFPDLNILSLSKREAHDLKKLKFSPEASLSIPSLPPSYLVINYCEQTADTDVKADGLENIQYPLAASEVLTCNISKCRRLSKNDSLKKTLEIHLALDMNYEICYEPGDSFGIIVRNSRIEVDLLLHLLNVKAKADIRCELSMDPETKKKTPVIPKFIPKISTLRYICTHCIDFRTVPKKPFLRSLIEYTKDYVEKRRLMELVSKEGTEDYNVFIREGGLTFLDFLILFKSCKPPISLILEHLPRLLPRPYSVTSSSIINSSNISFAFNVLEIPRERSVTFARKGICTGWLDKLTVDLQNELPSTVEEKLRAMNLSDEIVDNKVRIYFRSNKNFRLPRDLGTPLIMIGPGTGVAPFIGFLKHIEQLLKYADNEYEAGFTWLFFGCRNKDKDFLYRNELESFVESGTLSKLSTCFSRDQQAEGSPRYVQDNLIANGEDIVQLIDSKNGCIYVCGDAKNMSRNVFDTFIQILNKYLHLGDIDARKYLAQMQINSRYLQDVWT